MAYGDAAGFYNRYTGPMTDQMEHIDPLGGQDIHPQHAPDELPQNVIEHWLDMLSGRGDQYVPDSPGGIIGPGGGGPQGDFDPQNYIDQQMAGDVVPTSRYLPAGQAQDIQRRMSNPDTVRGSMGQLSIDTMGGAKSPYIDLMDVLMGRIGTRR